MQRKINSRGVRFISQMISENVDEKPVSLLQLPAEKLLQAIRQQNISRRGFAQKVRRHFKIPADNNCRFYGPGSHNPSPKGMRPLGSMPQPLETIHNTGGPGGEPWRSQEYHMGYGDIQCTLQTEMRKDGNKTEFIPTGSLIVWFWDHKSLQHWLSIRPFEIMELLELDGPEDPKVREVIVYADQPSTPTLSPDYRKTSGGIIIYTLKPMTWEFSENRDDDNDDYDGTISSDFYGDFDDYNDDFDDDDSDDEDFDDDYIRDRYPRPGNPYR